MMISVEREQSSAALDTTNPAAAVRRISMKVTHYTCKRQQNKTSAIPNTSWLLAPSSDKIRISWILPYSYFPYMIKRSRDLII